MVILLFNSWMVFIISYDVIVLCFFEWLLTLIMVSVCVAHALSFFSEVSNIVLLVAMLIL